MRHRVRAAQGVDLAAGRGLVGWALVLALVGAGCGSCDGRGTTDTPKDAGPGTHDAGRRDAGRPDSGRPDAGPGAGPGAGPVHVDRRGRFLGEPDWPMRRALATEEVAEIEKGHGGRSLAFKITLADGTVGYYKPEQTFSAAHWYGEVASYYLDRELGLGRAIPTIGRRLPWQPLREAAGGDSRVDEIIVQDDGTVRGAFIWWVPGGLRPIAPGTGWERWVRVQGSLVVTPYQRPRGWSRDVNRWRRETGSESSDGTETAPAPEEPDTEVSGPPAGEPDTADRPAELSDMILFDYLTTNVDRWGGSFTNVRTRGVGGPLVYLDNAAGFTAGPRARIPLMDARLHALSRFRRSTVAAIGALSMERLARRMGDDPLAPVLTTRQLDQLEERRRHLLEYVARIQREHGEAATPWE